MKKIGLISDTHGWLDDRVFHHFDSCDEVWHAGDVGSEEIIDRLEAFRPLRAVFGNIDDHLLRQRIPEHQRFTLEGVDTWITHIGGRPGNYATPVRQELKQNPPTLFVCGHSHICLVQMDKQVGVLHMNPGAAGRHGFHKVRTLLRFTLESGNIHSLSAVELGKRV